MVDFTTEVVNPLIALSILKTDSGSQVLRFADWHDGNREKSKIWSILGTRQRFQLKVDLLLQA